MLDVHQERVWIAGPQGKLAGELSYGGGEARGAALILSPHPNMGGRMRLPLLNHLATALARTNITALRFDYGGVGESEGPPVRIGAAMQQFWSTGAAPEDPLRTEEAKAARAWLAGCTSERTCLIGYSFGASVAAGIQNVDDAGMVMIAPTIARHDYSVLSGCRLPMLVVCGEGDFATSQERMESWLSGLSSNAAVKRFPAGDHFFRGIEAAVAHEVRDFVTNVCGRTSEVTR